MRSSSRTPCIPRVFLVYSSCQPSTFVTFVERIRRAELADSPRSLTHLTFYGLSTHSSSPTFIPHPQSDLPIRYFLLFVLHTTGHRPISRTRHAGSSALPQRSNKEARTSHVGSQVVSEICRISDVLALASGQKAMAFWLWYQSQSRAKILAWHGFWPGLNMFQARAGPESHGFWTPLCTS